MAIIMDGKALAVKMQDQLQEKVARLKEKEWTLWFDAESHLLKKVFFDSSVEDNFTLYLLSAQDPESDFAKQRPKKGTTIWNIKMGDECDTINLPEEYKEF